MDWPALTYVLDVHIRVAYIYYISTSIHWTPPARVIFSPAAAIGWHVLSMGSTCGND
jgi:hypothetical protein